MTGQVFVGRQPILDADMQVFAYELNFNQGLNPSKETVEATANLIAEMDEKIGFQNMVGSNGVMMQLPKDLIKADELPKFNDEQQVVLEIPNNVTKDVEVLKNLKDLSGRGVELALNDYISDESSIKLASISDFVKIDVEDYSERQLKSMIEALHQKNIKVIAEKVETEESFRYLKKLGFDFFLGYFFTNPVVINGEKLSGNKMTLIQLLAKVNDEETDFHELSNIIGQDVALTHQLLLAVNNPAAMIPVKVENVSDALKYMGLKRLKFWVNMLLLSGIDDVPKELVITSLMHARFCEDLAEKAGHIHDKDSYFLVGLFSNLGAFFRTPIDTIVAEMPLADSVKEALVNHKGPMGKALACLKALEQGNSSVTNLTFEKLTINEIGSIFMSASAWAQQVMEN